ncbi:MAG: PQQ-binding-like beta-propeller repeat protein [Acidobacteriota bacterium]|nr:PQQ-binding-like beta-propeller repeat protein [Acidobacteriota bacterium]
MNDEIQSKTAGFRPVLYILGFLLAALGFIWGVIDWTQQSVKWLVSFYAIGGSVFVLLLWFFFFSRLRRKVKAIGLGVLIALGLFVYSAVDIREVDGDVIPILAWSWEPPADEALANRSITAEGRTTRNTRAGGDFPRFLGPDGTGTIENIDPASDWKTRPPREIWRIPVGAAWSGFAVKDGLAVTQEQRGEREMVTCYLLESGELVWAHGDPQRFATTVGGNGPRATPTIADGKVYSLGALGLLNCLDSASGKLLWQKDTAREHGAEKPRWGYSCSPLVIPASESAGGRTLVVVSPGGPNGRSLAAYDADNGDLVWTGGNAKPGYSSPSLVTLAGSPMILIFNNGSVAGHHPRDGRVLWETPWPGDKPSVANPRVLSGDRVLVSAGYGLGAKMYRVANQDSAFSAETIYETPRLKAKFANFVLYGDHAYGLDDGVLTCVDTADGQRVWKKGRYGHGQLLLTGGYLLVQSEGGGLHILEARPEGHKELGSIQVLGGKSWNTPALAGNRLLMRNHKEAVCLELPLD